MNFTIPSYTTLTDLGTSGYSTSGTALYSADNEAYSFNTVASSSYSLQSGSSKYPNISVMRDTTVSAYCDLPLIITPNSVVIDASPATFPITSLKDCSGTIYKATTFTWPDGGSASGNAFNSVT